MIKEVKQTINSGKAKELRNFTGSALIMDGDKIIQEIEHKSNTVTRTPSKYQLRYGTKTEIANEINNKK